MTADQELDRVVAWLRREALSTVPEWLDCDRMTFRAWFWGMLHPFKLRIELGRMGAYHRAITALTRHEHRETNDG